MISELDRFYMNNTSDRNVHGRAESVLNNFCVYIYFLLSRNNQFYLNHVPRRYMLSSSSIIHDNHAWIGISAVVSIESQRCVNTRHCVAESILAGNPFVRATVNRKSIRFSRRCSMRPCIIYNFRGITGRQSRENDSRCLRHLNTMLCSQRRASLIAKSARCCINKPLTRDHAGQNRRTRVATIAGHAANFSKEFAPHWSIANKRFVSAQLARKQE